MIFNRWNRFPYFSAPCSNADKTTERVFYADSKPHFSKSKLNAILHDLSYIGFVRFKGNWCEGHHEALVDQVTWDLVRVSLLEQKYRSHELVYASQLIRCGHCGHVVTGEEKLKTTKNGTRSYVYYRCARYWTTDHPRRQNKSKSK